MRATADSWIRGATVTAVVTVSGIAAIVSYNHIVRVSITHGQTLTDARLMPVSVDGLIMAASFTAFLASRNRLPVPALARVALVLGIGATIAANCLYGIAHGWLGAVISAWPACAFIMAIELVIYVVRITAGGRASSRRSNRRASAVRDWARSRGMDVGNRGRLADEVKEAYAQNAAATNVRNSVTLIDEPETGIMPEQTELDFSEFRPELAAASNNHESAS